MGGRIYGIDFRISFLGIDDAGDAQHPLPQRFAVKIHARKEVPKAERRRRDLLF